MTGEFEREEDAFRDWVSKDGSTRFPAVSGRYHLYISLACPWACRTLIVRHLKGLQEVVGVTVVDPIRDRGWAFRDGPGHSADPVSGFQFLSEAYGATDRNFRGRVTPTPSITCISNAICAGSSISKTSTGTCSISTNRPASPTR
jgi:glutathionyl-hydroquinone reductase